MGLELFSVCTSNLICISSLLKHLGTLDGLLRVKLLTTLLLAKILPLWATGFWIPILKPPFFVSIFSSSVVFLSYPGALEEVEEWDEVNFDGGLSLYFANFDLFKSSGYLDFLRNLLTLFQSLKDPLELLLMKYPFNLNFSRKCSFKVLIFFSLSSSSITSILLLESCSSSSSSSIETEGSLDKRLGLEFNDFLGEVYLENFDF